MKRASSVLATLAVFAVTSLLGGHNAPPKFDFGPFSALGGWGEAA